MNVAWLSSMFLKPKKNKKGRSVLQEPRLPHSETCSLDLDGHMSMSFSISDPTSLCNFFYCSTRNSSFRFLSANYTLPFIFWATVKLRLFT